MQGSWGKPLKTSGEKLEKKDKGSSSTLYTLERNLKDKRNFYLSLLLPYLFMKCKVEKQSLKRPLGRSSRKKTGAVAVLCTPENEI